MFFTRRATLAGRRTSACPCARSRLALSRRHEDDIDKTLITMKRSTKNSTRDISIPVWPTVDLHLSQEARRPHAQESKSSKHAQLPHANSTRPASCNPIAASAASQKQRSVLNSEVIPDKAATQYPAHSSPTCSHGTPRARAPTRAPSQSIPQPRPLPNRPPGPAPHVPCPPTHIFSL